MAGTGRAPEFFYFAPKVATVFSFVSTLLFPALFSHLIWVIALTVSVAAASLATLVVLATRRYHRKWMLAGLLTQALLIILNFGSAFSLYGLSTGSNLEGAPVSFWTGLYFSVVTWTTLGYGDFTPRPNIRLLAALEAAMGYLYFGLIVGKMAESYVGSRAEHEQSLPQQLPELD